MTKGTVCSPDGGVLLAPVFAVSEFGKTRELPAGWAYEVVRFNAVKSCADTVTILARDPEQDWNENEVWYVAEDPKWEAVRRFMEETPQTMPATPPSLTPGSGLARAAARRRRS